jgi:hypothetical protein
LHHVEAIRRLLRQQLRQLRVHYYRSPNVI